MTFKTGLEQLLEKVAFNVGPSTAFHPEAMHPQYAARVQQRMQARPLPETPMNTQLPGPGRMSGGMVGPNSIAQHAQMEAHQMHEPLMHEVITQGNQMAAANPNLGQGMAPPLSRGARIRGAVGNAASNVGSGVRAGMGKLVSPLALGLGGALVGGQLMSGYNDDQRYNNLAYTPIGPNAV